MPRINQSIETSILREHGELIEQRINRTFSWGNEPPYIKLYLQDILFLSDLPRGHENILYALLKRTCYATDSKGMQLSISIGIKKIIAKELGLQNVRSINNVLSDLVRGKLLMRIEKGLYDLNPYLFAKGDWQNISRLRLQIDYSKIKGRTFRSLIGFDNKPKLEIEESVISC
jgi:hypothetical protein